MNAAARLLTPSALAIALFAAAAAPTSPALAQQSRPAPDEQPRDVRASRPTLTVSGQSRLEVAPDELRLSFTIVTEGGENIPARDIMNENSRAAEQVVEALRAAGLGERAIETGRFNVFPRYSQPRRGEPNRIVGYRVENDLRVTSKEIERAGEFIQTAVEAGANQVSSISFGLSDEREHRSTAITEATRHARADAEALAAAAGVRIVRALRIDLDQPNFGPVQPRAMDMMMRATAEDAPPPPIQPGDVEVTARVTIVYEISEGE